MQIAAPPGSTVRDALGWHKVERSRGLYNIPMNNWQLYKQVAAIGDKNVITLFAGNPLYGMATFGFPVTTEQIQGWANFAAYVVAHDGHSTPDRKTANIPNLEAVTIWNEFNGTWNGGIRGTGQQEAAMAKLLNVVVPAIRAANPTVKIGAGAFIGDGGLSSWFKTIGAEFDWDSVDWLDVHTYIGPNGEKEWREEVAALRAAGIVNPFYFSEWGGNPAVEYARRFPGKNYVQWFVSNVIERDTVVPAGGDYFTLDDGRRWPVQGLTTGPDGAPPYQLTALGTAYVSFFLPWAATQ
jgi:hypothetical protein